MKLYRIIERLPFPDVVEMVNLQKVTNAQVARLNRAENKQSIQNYFFWIGLACYHYGVMAGKRAERAKRKKAAIGAGTPTTAVDTMQDRQSVKCEYNTKARDMEGTSV
ncbi:MAG: hypothetical protein ACFNLO_00275 [Selenomonas massiliensis]